jgi:hypothetical protein
MHDQIRPERPKYHALSALDQIVFSPQGRRAPLRFALALAFIFRAFGALFRLFVESNE